MVLLSTVRKEVLYYEEELTHSNGDSQLFAKLTRHGSGCMFTGLNPASGQSPKEIAFGAVE